MSTTSEKLTTILDSKTAIKNAIQSKGVTVGDAPLTDYADLIEDITVESIWESNNPLRLTAKTAGASVTLEKSGTFTVEPYVFYKTNTMQNWSSYTFGTAVTLTNIDDYIQFVNVKKVTGSGTSNYLHFVFAQNDIIQASGNVNSLINFIDSVPNYGFHRLFYQCTGLTTAPALPATTLANYSYREMFNGCTGLTVAPSLPATTLGNACYYMMFSNCTSLTTPPSTLPATTLKNQCYYWMFSACSALTTAPTLPATTLIKQCYSNMFKNCTSLTTAPTLSATTIAQQCYQQMFQGCTSLTTAPELPATTLESMCYNGMFTGCTSLTTAPTLPATTLVSTCYSSMFSNCTSLTTAPSLPATTLAQQCYSSMFKGCTSLTSAPSLPATTLVGNQCYYQMFQNCSSLSSIDVNFTEWLTTGFTNQTGNWLDGVSATGTFIKPSALTEQTGVSNIPSGWTVVNKPIPLTLTAKTAGATVKITKTGSPTVSGLKYRRNASDEWSTYNIDDVITLTNVDDYVQFMNTENTLSSNTNSSYARFVLNGDIEASGSVQSMLNYSNTCPNYCFTRLFVWNTSLKKAPELPAQTLGSHCYREMFNGCTGLTTAPSTLPATTLAQSCYYSMFRDCTSLTSAPKLLATTDDSECCSYMFYGCRSLNSIQVSFTSWTGRTYYWVIGVSATGTFTKPTALAEEYGASKIPDGWTVVNK